MEKQNGYAQKLTYILTTDMLFIMGPKENMGNSAAARASGGVRRAGVRGDRLCRGEPGGRQFQESAGRRVHRPL